MGLAAHQTHHAVRALEVGAEVEEVPRLIVRQRRSGEPLNMLEALPDLTLKGHAVALCLALASWHRQRLIERVQLLPHLARDRFADPARELARLPHAGHERVGVEPIRQEIKGHVLGREIHRTDERSPEVTDLDADVELEVPRHVDQA